jgi:hypothetical protein
MLFAKSKTKKTIKTIALRDRPKWNDSHFGSIQHLLNYLGIEFHPSSRMKEETFWDSNRFILKEIYREFIYESKLKIRELHPDKGGDGHEFGEFIKAIKKYKWKFAQELHISPGEELPAAPTVLFVPRGASKWKTKNGFYQSKRVFEAIELMRKGLSNCQIRRELKMGKDTVIKIRKLLPEKDIKCPCGSPSQHPGPCKYRMKHAA